MKTYAVIIFLTVFPFIAKTQIIKLFAGSGSVLGDGGLATSANIPDPSGGIFDRNDNYYIASALGGNRVRKVDTAGIITTVAGTGVLGYNGDNIPAASAQLNIPGAVKFDSRGNLYICEGQGNRIRKVNMITNIITTYAGTGVAGYSGDSGLATAAMVNDPQDICFDKLGNLYIADWGNERIRKIDTLGIITTIAGVGFAGYSGDGSLADTSKIGSIVGMCFDNSGNLYLADNSNSRIFKINTSGIISTFAGTSTGFLYNGDNILATTANIDPVRITFDDTGNLFIAENQNHRVRKVDTFGIIHTVAGNGIAGSSGEGGQAIDVELNYPTGVAFDYCGNLYVPESGNKRVSKVIFDSTCTYHNFGVKEVINSPNITVYPNPASEVIHIEGLKAATNYGIINILGILEQIGTLKDGSNSIDVRALPPGMHLLEMRDNEGIKTVKKVFKL